MAIDGEPVADDDARRAAVRGRRSSSSSVGIDAVVLRDHRRGRASRWFADEAVDVAVVEVGLGGTWDATNVVDARGRGGHQRRGRPRRVSRPTREQIAHREGGHREAGLDARARRDRPEALRADLRRRATPRGILVRDARLRRRATTCSRSAAGSSTSTRRARAYPDVFLPLHGAHQGDNAGDRARGRRSVRRRRRSRRGRADAFATVQSPGRLEVVGRQPLVLLDGAHNVAGARGVAAARSTRSSATGPRTLVVGLLREKEPHEMLAALGVGDRPDDADGRDPRVLPPAEPAGARARGRGQGGDRLGCREDRIEIVDTRRRSGQHRARWPRPTTARSSSPARCTSSARPASVLRGLTRRTSAEASRGHRRERDRAGAPVGVRSRSSDDPNSSRVCDVDCRAAEKAAADHRGRGVHRCRRDCSRAALSTRS